MLIQEDIKKILEYGVMAPSSHNSQPWKFEVSGDTIKVLPDFKRRLKESDKNDRQLFISLGCVAENILESATALGFNPQQSITDNGEVAIILGKKIGSIDEATLSAIENRVTNRNKYTDDESLADFKRFIIGLQSGGMQISVCEGERKERLADIAVDASVEAMEDAGFREELSQYVKNNLTKSKVGMPMYGMGIPTLISFLGPYLVRSLNVNKLSQKSDRKLLKEGTPQLVVIATKEDDKKSWIKTGLTYEKIALEAERQGLSTAMWAAPIQIGEYYKDFQTILNTNLRPQAFFRLGKSSKQTKHSPRIPADEIAK